MISPWCKKRSKAGNLKHPWCVVPGKETSGSPEAPQHNAPLSIPLPGFTALMQSWGIPMCLCGTVVFWCFRAPCPPSPSENTKQCFPPFCGILLLDLWICVGTILGALEDEHEQKDKDVGKEKQQWFAGFDLLDFCFSYPVSRIKLISRSSWEKIFPLRLFVRDFLCLPLLSIREVILEALLQALWPQPLHSLAFS